MLSFQETAASLLPTLCVHVCSMGVRQLGGNVGGKNLLQPIGFYRNKQFLG